MTENCNSGAITVEDFGFYGMSELYDDEMCRVFQSSNHIIGNAVLYPIGMGHSFVPMGMSDGKAQIYDPWTAAPIYSTREVFGDGFPSTLGIRGYQVDAVYRGGLKQM